MNTESPDVGTRLTSDPEDGKMALVVEFVVFGLVDGSNTELALDGRDQWRTLQESTRQEMQHANVSLLSARNSAMEADNCNILLSGTLLRLDKTSGTIQGDNETSSDLGIERSTVSSLLDAENAFDPGYDFVAGGIRGLVKVDDARADVGFDVAVQGGTADRNRSEMTGADKDYSTISWVVDVECNIAYGRCNF